MKKIVSVIFILLLVAQSYSFAQTYKVIVNQQNAGGSFTKKEISDFFLKKKTKWASGISIAPVDLNVNSKTRDDFSQQIHGKSTSAIRSFWQQAAFSGTASAPPEKASDAEVIDFVQKNPGGIGYISITTKVEGLKVLVIN